MKIITRAIAIKNLKNKFSDVPSYVVEWTDKYFHQSAFDIPVNYPSKKVVTFLFHFKKRRPVKLFRGINKYNEDNFLVMSWTYNRKIAERYAEETNGRVMEKLFSPEQILLDTTILTEEQKLQLGYDYKVDDKEVLVLS